MAGSTGYTTKYIIGFALAVCVVCSVAVSGMAVLLKPAQEKNKLLDRQKKVLTVAGLMEEGEELSDAKVSTLFKERIVPRVVDLKTGEYNDDIDPQTYDQRKARQDPKMSEKAPPNRSKIQRLPKYALVYLVTNDQDEVTRVILPVEGYGLWSTLYGYLALEADTRTVAGITFYEHGETPGLGGEVDNPKWKGLFPGTYAYDQNWQVAIRVIKGQAPEGSKYEISGLTGATLTTRGVNNLLRFWLGPDGFEPYLEKFRTEHAEAT